MSKKIRYQLLVLNMCLVLILSGIIPTRAQDLPHSNSLKPVCPESSPCSLTMDGRLVHLTLPLRLTPDNQSLISIQDLIPAFSCHLEFDDQGCLNLNHLDKSISFAPGQYYSCLPLDQLSSLQQLEALYVPLRAVSRAFGYVIGYYAEQNQISVDTPDYREKITPDPPLSPGPPEPPAPPANLPTWGALAPELAVRWPGEKVISGYYTTLINSPAGRTENIALSCSRIDETVLQPDQVFSFNQTVGERTAEAGYQEAKIFMGQKVVRGLGGGICQTASTLYNVALEAGLNIVERYPHSLKVAYVASGRDATVSWGGADLKFANNLGRPVKIRTCIYGSYVIAALCECAQ